MFLFVRVLPMISIFEMRTLVPGGGHSIHPSSPAPQPASGD
jgi:hypothetical protein